MSNSPIESLESDARMGSITLSKFLKQNPNDHRIPSAILEVLLELREIILSHGEQ